MLIGSAIASVATVVLAVWVYIGPVDTPLDIRKTDPAEEDVGRLLFDAVSKEIVNDSKWSITRFRCPDFRNLTRADIQARQPVGRWQLVSRCEARFEQNASTGYSGILVPYVVKVDAQGCYEIVALILEAQYEGLAQQYGSPGAALGEYNGCIEGLTAPGTEPAT